MAVGNNPYYYGRAENVDPTYIYLMQLLQQILSSSQGGPSTPGPGGSYNPFAWMDEGGMTPAQKRAADEARQAADAKQAMEWNLRQPGLREYLGKPHTPMAPEGPQFLPGWMGQGVLPATGEMKPTGPTEFTYQPTAQDLATWKAAEQIGMMQNLGVPSAPSRGRTQEGTRSAATRTTGGPSSEVMKAMIGAIDPQIEVQLKSIDDELKALLAQSPLDEEEKAQVEKLRTMKAELLQKAGAGNLDQVTALMGLLMGGNKGPSGGGFIAKGAGWEKPSATRFGTPTATKGERFAVNDNIIAMADALGISKEEAQKILSGLPASSESGSDDMRNVVQFAIKWVNENFPNASDKEKAARVHEFVTQYRNAE